MTQKANGPSDPCANSNAPECTVTVTGARRSGGFQLAQYTPIPPGVLPNPSNDNEGSDQARCESALKICRSAGRLDAGPGKYGEWLQDCVAAFDLCIGKANNPFQRGRGGDVIEFRGGVMIIYRGPGRDSVIIRTGP